MYGRSRENTSSILIYKVAAVLGVLGLALSACKKVDATVQITNEAKPGTIETFCGALPGIIGRIYDADAKSRYGKDIVPVCKRTADAKNYPSVCSSKENATNFGISTIYAILGNPKFASLNDYRGEQFTAEAGSKADSACDTQNR